MPETILILEDMPELSDLMALVLQRNGFNVTVAATIEEARRAWSQLNGADMLISDAHVPDGSGLRLAAELKQEKPGLHVIISTGNLSDPLPPGYDLLLKPFNLQLFVKMVQSRFTSDRPGAVE